MCGRIVNLDTVARVLADYYHLKTDTQLAALNDALSRVPAETVGKELFGNSEQLDTISRQAAIDALMEIMDRPNHAEFLYTDEICKTLNELPSAEPERKQGEWIRYGEDGEPNDVDTVFWQCDQCLNTETGRRDKPMDFCPNCGADMRGEQDE